MSPEGKSSSFMMPTLAARLVSMPPWRGHHSTNCEASTRQLEECPLER